MIKFFVRILKFSGKYKGRVLSAALFAFIKGICITMPLFLGFLLFNEFYEEDDHRSSLSYIFCGHGALVCRTYSRHKLKRQVAEYGGV